MPVLTPQQLINSLNQGIQSLYILHGEEELLRLESLDAIRLAAKQQGYLNREVFVVEAKFDWSVLLNAIGSVGLFSELKLLEIHIPNGKPGKEGAEFLVHLADTLPEDICVVLVLPKLEKAQLQAKWWVKLQAAAYTVDAKLISPAQLPSWIRERLRHYHLSIEDDALELFADRVEGNLLAAKQEIDKMSLLYPEGSSLDMAAAQMAVANVARFDVFQLANAWMSGDVMRTQRCLDGLEAENDQPVVLVNILAADLQILIRVLAALKQGDDLYRLRNSLRLWGDKMTLAPQAAKRIGVNRLIQAIQECALIDQEIKGVASGDAWVHLKKLTMSLAT